MPNNIIVAEKILNLNPLFWPGQGNLVIKNKKKNIFLGVGIANPQKLSSSVPFDLVGFILSAEFIKRNIPNTKVFMLIADQHAWLVNKINKDQSKKVASALLSVINDMIKAFKLQNWQVFLASDVFPTDSHSASWRIGMTRKTNLSYEELEKRDVLNFFNNHDTGIKIGWQFSSGNSAHKTDESHFDKNISQITSLFIRPAETFSCQKPQESPYICTDSNSRIVLSPDENVTEKISTIKQITDENRFQAVQNHLRRITILFEMLFGDFPPKTTVEKKVQSIINRVFEK